MRFKNILSIIITASLLWSCNNKTKNENTDNFDVSTILTNVGDNIITPQYSELKSSITVMKNDFNEFNDSPEAANLTKLQNSFKTAYSDWQGCSFVNFGNTNITTLRNVFNTYPTDTGNVNSTFTVTDFNLESASYADAIGFPALDYLLHGLADTDAAILDKYTTGENKDNYKNYISAVLGQMNTLTTSVASDFKAQRNIFVESTENTATSSVNKLINDYIFYYEKGLRANKFGIPSGIFSSTPLYDFSSYS